MLCKIERSLFRLIQISILIQVLTSTVLCNKKESEPEQVAIKTGDVCWTNFPGLSKKGGKKTDATDLASCQSACLKNSDCGSIDFDPTSNDCWLHTRHKKENKQGIQHYEYACSGTSPLNSCRLTTTSTTLEFNKPGIAQCTTQQNVTVTKCSGSCPDGGGEGNVGRVFLSGTTTVLKEDKTCSSCQGSGGGVKRYEVHCVDSYGWGGTIAIDVEEFTECTCKKCTV